MAAEVSGFLDDLRRSARAPIEIEADFDGIVICGMGGSAIVGDIIRDCVIGEASVPIHVQRFPDLPSWVGPGTLVIASSYSGNTRETKSMYLQARERGCRILAMASGGDLLRLGRENGDIVVEMRRGLQPRSALGMSLGHLAGVTDSLLGTRCRERIEEILPSLCGLRGELEREGSLADEIAAELSGRIPIIYATPGIGSSATRWKTQINENSKMLAFTGSVPEFNPNELSGWSEGEDRLMDKCAHVFLCEEGARKANLDMAERAMSSLRGRG